MSSGASFIVICCIPSVVFMVLKVAFGSVLAICFLDLFSLLFTPSQFAFSLLSIFLSRVVQRKRSRIELLDIWWEKWLQSGGDVCLEVIVGREKDIKGSPLEGKEEICLKVKELFGAEGSFLKFNTPMK